MTLIGDVDPEDAYDARDPIPDRLQVLARVVAAVLIERGTAPARANRRLEDARRALFAVLQDLEDL